MNEWRITIKERKSSAPIITTHHGNLDKEGVIEFLGLHHSDVEWYRIEQIILIEEKENHKSDDADIPNWHGFHPVEE